MNLPHGGGCGFVLPGFHSWRCPPVLAQLHAPKRLAGHGLHQIVHRVLGLALKNEWVEIKSANPSILLEIKASNQGWKHQSDIFCNYWRIKTSKAQQVVPCAVRPISQGRSAHDFIARVLQRPEVHDMCWGDVAISAMWVRYLNTCVGTNEIWWVYHHFNGIERLQ